MRRRELPIAILKKTTIKHTNAPRKAGRRREKQGGGRRRREEEGDGRIRKEK